jgi:mRNA-degrading endonuclease RelE of RelBE toxin-antitoxin system
MTIRFAAPFVKDYRRLSPLIQQKVDLLLTELASNLHYPSLRVRKMVNHPSIYEARIDGQYRVTFEKQADLLVMRRVGTHAIYKKP